MVVWLYALVTLLSSLLFMSIPSPTTTKTTAATVRLIRDNNCSVHRVITTFRKITTLSFTTTLTAVSGWSHPQLRSFSTSIRNYSHRTVLLNDHRNAFSDIPTILRKHRMISPSQPSSSSHGGVVKIAIIGAGPAGLVAARVLSRTIEQYRTKESQQPLLLLPQFVITVFEKENDIGGVWRYPPNGTTLSSNSASLISSSAVRTTTTTIPKKKNHPMYRNLRTNLPKEIMAFREYPWKTVSSLTPQPQQQYGSTIDNTITEPTTAPTTTTTTCNSNTEGTKPITSQNKTNQNISYVSHYNVYEYLHQYCQLYQLHELIQYHCTVRQLTCLPTTTNTQTNGTTSKSYFSPTLSRTTSNTSPDEEAQEEELWPLIHLTWDETTSPTNDQQPQQQQSDVFDAIFICNGHYNAPSYPNIPGLLEYFQGTILHSVEYDIPDPFIDQTILCIGGRASGSDIAREIANHQHRHATTATTKVYLSDTSNDRITQPNNNVIWVPKTICVRPDGRIQLDSHSMEPIQVDTIILCTGYDYDFPFINEKSNMHDFLSCDQRRVQLLYEQLWYVSAPNIALVGIPHSIIPFPLFEFQCEAVVQSWFRSTRHNETMIASPNDIHHKTSTTTVRTLPNTKIRYERAMIDANAGGYGKEKGRVPEDTHYLGPYQWDYCRTMAQYANIYNDTVESYIATNKVRPIDTFDFVA